METRDGGEGRALWQREEGLAASIRHTRCAERQCADAQTAEVICCVGVLAPSAQHLNSEFAHSSRAPLCAFPLRQLISCNPAPSLLSSCGSG
jgi:hypothetical protein